MPGVAGLQPRRREQGSAALPAAAGDPGGARGSTSTTRHARHSAASTAAPTSSAGAHPPTAPPLYFSTFGNANPPGCGRHGGRRRHLLLERHTRSAAIDRCHRHRPCRCRPAPTSTASTASTPRSSTCRSAATSTVPGIGIVADEDVVFYNAGELVAVLQRQRQRCRKHGSGCDQHRRWLALLLHRHHAVPPGAGGSGDDADIYRWNGGSSYTRVRDASALGVVDRQRRRPRVGRRHARLPVLQPEHDRAGHRRQFRTRTSSATTAARGRCTSTERPSASLPATSTWTRSMFRSSVHRRPGKG